MNNQERKELAELRGIVADQKRRLTYQDWKIKEMRLLSMQTVLDTAEQVSCFQSQLKSALATYDGSTGFSKETT